MKQPRSYLAGHDGLGELADYRELVAEVAVEGFELLGQNHRGEAAPVGDDISVMEVHHIRTLDERMGELLVLRIERMVDLERAAAFRNRAGNIQVAGDGHIAAELTVTTDCRLEIGFKTKSAKRSHSYQIRAAT